MIKSKQKKSMIKKNNLRSQSSPLSRPSISLCMIVKNEEEFLERCLKSVCDFVDEIIIVDTGSKDNTIAIAERFTDKIYHHPWEKSFSKARNQALQYASCDWVFQIDADEEMVEGGGLKLRKAVESAGNADIIFVIILSIYSSGSKTASHNFHRVFRNNGVIHYEGAVHNRIVGGTKALFSSVQLIHHGYNVDKEKSDAKFKRTTEILKQEISKDPLNPLYHHYMGVSYLSMNKNRESAEESELAITLADEQNKGDDPIYLWTHYDASMSNYRMRNMEKASFYAQKAHKISPKHLDSRYMLAAIAAEHSEWDIVISHANEYLNLLQLYEREPAKAGITVNNTMNEAAFVYSLLGHAYYGKGDKERMDLWYRKALESPDERGKISYSIGAFHLDKTADLEKARFYINMSMEQSSEEPGPRYLMAKYYMTAGLPSEEKQCLEWLYKNDASDAVIFNRLIQLSLEDDDLESALEVAQNAEKRFPDNYSYRQKQALIYRKKNEPEKAVKCYMNILEKHPELFDIWNELGILCLETGDMQNAGLFFEKAVLLTKEPTMPLFRLCEISIRRHSLENFIHYLSILIDNLKIPISKTIEDINDLLLVLIEVASTLRSDEIYSGLANTLVNHFRAEFSGLLTNNGEGTPYFSEDETTCKGVP